MREPRSAAALYVQQPACRTGGIRMRSAMNPNAVDKLWEDWNLARDEAQLKPIAPLE
jgi:hypothetical protein